MDYETEIKLKIEISKQKQNLISRLEKKLGDVVKENDALRAKGVSFEERKKQTDTTWMENYLHTLKNLHSTEVMSWWKDEDSIEIERDLEGFVRKYFNMLTQQHKPLDKSDATLQYVIDHARELYDELVKENPTNGRGHAINIGKKHNTFILYNGKEFFTIGL